MSKNVPKLKKVPGAGANGENYLEFKPDTVSLLTKTIEANLKNTQNGKLPQRKKNTITGNDYDRPQKKTEGKTYRPKPHQKDVPSNKKPTVTADPDSKPRGKKRLRDGQAKSSTDAISRPNNALKLKLSPNEGSVDHARLEQEILALGGSKDDLKLIQDGASESEFEGGTSSSEKPAAKGLKKELLRLVQELGIEKVSQGVDETFESDQDGINSDIQNTAMTGVQPERKEKSNSQPKQSGKSESQYVSQLVTDVHFVPSLSLIVASAS